MVESLLRQTEVDAGQTGPDLQRLEAALLSWESLEDAKTATWQEWQDTFDDSQWFRQVPEDTDTQVLRLEQDLLSEGYLPTMSQLGVGAYRGVNRDDEFVLGRCAGTPTGVSAGVRWLVEAAPAAVDEGGIAQQRRVEAMRVTCDGRWWAYWHTESEQWYFHREGCDVAVWDPDA